MQVNWEQLYNGVLLDYILTHFGMKYTLGFLLVSLDSLDQLYIYFR